MKFTPKLPQTVADSLKLKKPEPSLLVKARTHEAKAEALRQQEEVANREQLGPHKKQNPRDKPEKKVEAPRPHLEYLERWKVLDLAKDLLREVTTHLIAELQGAHDSFFAIGDRSTQGEQFRIDKAKKSGRAVPDANAAKGRPTVKPDALRPSPGARKA